VTSEKIRVSLAICKHRILFETTCELDRLDYMPVNTISLLSRFI
jgi:hypothetical protein